MMIDLPDSRQAEDLLRSLCASSPELARLAAQETLPARALRRIGLSHWQTGQLAPAAQAFEGALALNSGDADLWRNLASVYDGLSDAAKAKACVTGSLILDEGNAQSWMLLGRLADKVEAEHAYRRAIALDAGLADAHFGLGLLCFTQKRIDEAVASFRAAVTLAPDHPLAHRCLGQVLYMAADYAASAAAFEAGASGPLDPDSRRKYARARAFASMIEGRVDEALACYPTLAGDGAEPIGDIMRDAFHLLSAYGHPAAAAAVGRLRLAQNPQDPVQRYLLDAVTGQPVAQAPADYVEAYFDGFAPGFDHQLVNVLDYRVPERLCATVARHRARFADVLDLGCGTGLAAEHLAAFGERLAGVDLSGRMLEEAGRRGRYDVLVKAEATRYLDDHPDRFDLVFAADVLIYIGDAARLMAAVARALRQGGLFALSLETSADADFTVLTSGRFAHAPAYIERLAADDFHVLDLVPTTLRLEANKPVGGALMVLQRR